VGIFVSSGSVLEMEDVDLARTAARADGRRGVGLEVLDSVADVRNSRISSSALIHLLVAGDSQVTLTDTVLRETTGTRLGYAGWGMQISGDSRLSMTRGGTYDSAVVGAFITHGGHAEFHDTQITGTHRTRGIRNAVGILANDLATVTMEGGSITDNEGPGLVASRADVTVAGTTLLRNESAAVIGEGGAVVDLDSIDVADTRDGPEAGALGVVVQSNGFGTPTLRIQNASIGPHAAAGVWFSGPGSMTLEDSELEAGPGMARGGTLAHGNALFVSELASTTDNLLVTGNRFHGDGGLPVMLHHATGTFSDNVWESSGVHITQQACGELVPLTGVPGAVLDTCPDGNRLVDLSLGVPRFHLQDLPLDE
jgi:hypothetical protein